MERYCKNDKPYIYAAFPPDYQEQVLPVLESVAESGAQFWYARDFGRREKRRLRGAFGVLLFVTADFAADERFREIIDAAVLYGQKILCVYLETIPVTPWRAMQLGSQQALFTEKLDDAFVSTLKEAFIFQAMSVTTAQKRFQRNRAITMTVVPVLAAIILFFAVVNPLLIAPAMAAKNLAKQWGLTKEDLESITELHIVGDQTFDTFVHAWYEGNDRTRVGYDMNINNSMERQETIPVGTLTSEDLSILEYMPNLEVLEIEGQQITDISAVFDTRVGSLRLNCNPITSLEGIEKMECLNNLILSYTDVTDISPVLKLKHLRMLQLDGTNVSDISGVEALDGLETLMIGDTNVTKLPTFGAIENFTLDLRNLRIYDMSGIANVKSYHELLIDSMDDCMRPEDVMPYLIGKPIEKIGWCGIDSLEDIYDLNIVPGGSLGIANNFLTTLDGIEHFEGIGSLDIHHNSNGGRNYITDLTAILSLESLELLTVSSDMRSLVEEQLQGAHFRIEYGDD